MVKLVGKLLLLVIITGNIEVEVHKKRDRQ